MLILWNRIPENGRTWVRVSTTRTALVGRVTAFVVTSSPMRQIQQLSLDSRARLRPSLMVQRRQQTTKLTTTYSSAVVAGKGASCFGSKSAIAIVRRTPATEPVL